jgi:hypothetical protein
MESRSTPIRASIVGHPREATNIKICCHSGAMCSALGSFVM